MQSTLFSTLLLAFLWAPLLSADDLPWDTSPSTAWPAGSGQARIELRGDYLADFGVDIIQGQSARTERLTSPAQVESGRLWAWVPYGNFEAFNGGQLSLSSDLVLRYGNQIADFRNITLIPSEENKSAQLQVLDAGGNHLATITHIHAIANAQRNLLTLHNADIRGSDWLAAELGLPELSGMPLGQMWLDLIMDVPTGADLGMSSPDRGGLSCAGRPFWPQDNATRPIDRPEHLVDVEMVTLSTVAYQGRDSQSGRVKVAPSATLKSVGFGDAVWIPKFSQLGSYPFTPRDQHPFLVWNMYRIHDGRIEQLGSSGVKHAFLTLNFNCTINCGSNNILWPGCEDVYSSGTNDSNSNQGPREDIIASEGLFFSEGSFFDPNSTGSQTNNASSYENRLMIDESDLGVSNADYFLDAWYVVMDDINIWNSMGYHSIDPSPAGGGWSFGPLGPFVRDTPLTEWVPFRGSGSEEAHVSVEIEGPTPSATYPDNMPSGHFRALAKVEEVSEGVYTYRYAVMNFDFDRGFSEFEVPIADDACVSDVYVGGPTDVMTTPWTTSIGSDAIRFSAPPGEKLPWFTLYNFEITIDRAPAAESVVELSTFGSPGDPIPAHIPNSFSVRLPAPEAAPSGVSRIFSDRFESCLPLTE